MNKFEVIFRIIIDFAHFILTHTPTHIVIFLTLGKLNCPLNNANMRGKNTSSMCIKSHCLPFCFVTVFGRLFMKLVFLLWSVYIAEIVYQSL